MNDKNINDIPKAEDDAGDEDLENLSQTEKAAFEKIMSEISAGEGIPSDAISDAADSADESAAPEPAKEQVAGNNDDENDNEAGKEDDDLTDDQQGALDQIMAEIESGATDDPATEVQDAPETDEKKGAQEDELDPEQQAALDQIMAEIKGGGAEDPQPETQEAPETDEKKGAQEDELDPQQQAALDQIMAEIKGGDAEDPQPEAENAKNTSDAEAAAETPAEPLKPAPASSPDTPEEKKEPDGLSMDEFDDQLNSLISNANNGASEPEKTAPEPPSTPVPGAAEKSLEDINSTLKNIVNEGQDKSDEPENPEPEDDAADAAISESAFSELQEIDAAGDSKTVSPRSKTPGRLKKSLVAAAVACTCALLSMAGYWGYGRFFQPGGSVSNVPSVADTPTSAIPMDSQKITEPSEAVAQTDPVPQSPPPPVVPTAKPGPFAEVRADIVAARQKLEMRKTEIRDLKLYYQKGIQEEQAWLRSKQQTKPHAFSTALKNPKTELGLRSIQRRMIYNSKLDAPLLLLESYSEQLLYLERRVQLYELLDNAISGLTFTELKREGAELVQNIFRESDQLSIEHIEVAAPSLESIWKGLYERKAEATLPSASEIPLSAADIQIGKSICDGEYESKYLLTALTPQTAECLAKWPGMDLYLNELTHLPPEAAAKLAQWPGESLSLNGIKSLPAEAAKYLSQWPGKRISLNGVTDLSPEATAYLSKWQGDQLEMIGLTAIGRWENYVTRLFISENLRRKLHMQ